jgi:hypothetical protein
MLTKEQIDSLFDFCKTNGVRYYDVRVELVDHLANGIEKEMAEHPDCSFQQALDVVFASFGHQKFAPLLQEKRKAARLYCWRVFWAVFAEQAERPVTWLGLVVFLYSYHVLALHSRLAFLAAYIFASLAVCIWICVADWRVEKMQQRMGKRFILINMTRVKQLYNLYSYGGPPIIVLYLIESKILKTAFFSFGRLAETAVPYQLFFGALFYIFLLIGYTYFRTTVELRGKVKKDFTVGAISPAPYR